MGLDGQMGDDQMELEAFQDVAPSICKLQHEREVFMESIKSLIVECSL